MGYATIRGEDSHFCEITLSVAGNIIIWRVNRCGSWNLNQHPRIVVVSTHYSGNPKLAKNNPQEWTLQFVDLKYILFYSLIQNACNINQTNRLRYNLTANLINCHTSICIKRWLCLIRYKKWLQQTGPRSPHIGIHAR